MKSAFSKVIMIGSILALISNAAIAEVFLPGMQPKEAGIEFVKVQQCRMCHSGRHTPTVNTGTKSSWTCLKDAERSSSGLCMNQSPGST
jgi:hypothetical protein